MVWIIFMHYQELKTPVTSFPEEKDANIQASWWNYNNQYNATGISYTVEKCPVSSEVVV
jgi:hypothetical protein